MSLEVYCNAVPMGIKSQQLAEYLMNYAETMHISLALAERCDAILVL